VAWRKRSRWSLRLALAAINLGAALGKALDLPGFVRVLKTYQLFPVWSLWPMAILAVLVEGTLGVWLLTGRRLVVAAALSAFVSAMYGIVLSITLARGLELSNCGCFGVFLPRPLRWFSPVEDGVMVLASLLLRALAQRRMPGSPKPSRSM
jgi:Methylamine utilisation protein MauE